MLRTIRAVFTIGVCLACSFSSAYSQSKPIAERILNSPPEEIREKIVSSRRGALEISVPEAWQVRQREALQSNSLIGYLAHDSYDDQNGTAINVYHWENKTNYSLADWVKYFEGHWFDDPDSTVSLNARIGNRPAILASKCPSSKDHMLYFEGPENTIIGMSYYDHYLSEIEENIDKLKIKTGQGQNALSRLGKLKKDTKNIYMKTECLPEDGLDGIGQSSAGESCKWQEPTENKCCSKFTDENGYWKCSQGASSGNEYGNCTWWAAHKRSDVGKSVETSRKESGQPSGDAHNWENHAFRKEFNVNDCPRSDAIYVRESGGGYSVGHVAYVESTDRANKKVGVTEMNWCQTCNQSATHNASPSSAISFIHTNQKEVQFYWDPGEGSGDRMVTDYKNPGLCGGREAPHYPGLDTYQNKFQNMPDWFDNQASAIKVPEGWSVRVWRDKDRKGPSLCLNQSLKKMDSTNFAGTTTKLDDNISSFQVFDMLDCVDRCTPPVNGDWVVESSCEYTGNAKAPANVIVRNDSVLTIAPTATLDIDFDRHRLQVVNGSGVLIKPEGRIQ